MLNIAANTMPMAMELVTYGRKKIVCSAFCSGLIELSATAISSASSVEIGTVQMHRSTVFFRQARNRRYLTTFSKLPNPSWKLSPAAAFSPL